MHYICYTVKFIKKIPFSSDIQGQTVFNNWLREPDLNRRPSGYEPEKQQFSLPRKPCIIGKFVMRLWLVTFLARAIPCHRYDNNRNTLAWQTL